MEDSKGFLPGRHAIEGYRAGGFHFAGMSHQGSILVLPTGIYAWDVTDAPGITLEACARIVAEAADIDHLLIGTGASLLPLFDLRAQLRARGINTEPMATAAAARTYSILLGEKRKVAAALLAVP